MDPRPPAWRAALGPSLAGATGLALLQTLAALAEARRGGQDVDLFGALLHSAAYYPPWAAFGVLAYAALARAGDGLREARVALGGFVLAWFTFHLPYVLYEILVAELQAGRPWRGLWATVAGYPPFTLFVDFVLFTGAYAVVYGAALARAELARERQERKMEAEILSLRLEVERQRLSALQAQLEPHFLFNALNAVAGLIRSGASAEALGALTQIGALLRYASTASRSEWVGLDEELAFVDDYLALQRLRYGDRLRIERRLSGDPAEIRCPPLLIQPLVENAIRHDLDVSGGDGMLALDVVVGRAGAEVRVENAARRGRPPNPGLGLGLASVGERLALRYPGAPPLEAGVRGDRFVVRLAIPRSDDA